MTLYEKLSLLIAALALAGEQEKYLGEHDSSGIWYQRGVA